MLLECPLVEHIDLRDLSDTASGDDVLAHVSSVTGVRPARKTLAPSRAKARATALPIAPPAPYITAFLFVSSTCFSLVSHLMCTQVGHNYMAA
ncbi:MAG TPA: hypothetical protein VFS21_25395 [Roseiflexaceae bacterium]|nr:hypothetical protein [Roseiflexaceae bacterium]